VASLLGSLHCAGMCGGIVSMCVGVADDERGESRRRWRLHAAYNAGRLVTYMTLGAIAGGLGAAVELGGDFFGVQRAAAIVAGASMIAFGVVALLRAFGVRISAGRVPGWIQSPMRRGYEFAFNRPPVVRAGLIGLMTGVLPCGWLWAFVIVASGTGHVLLGALTMAVFWSGTLPVMLAVGVGVQALAGPLRRHLPLATAALLIFVGVVAVTGRLTMPAMAADLPTLADDQSPLDAAIEHVESIDHSSLPCCHDDSDSAN